MAMIKLAYGLKMFDGTLGETDLGPVQWFNTLAETEDAHQKVGHPYAEIAVYGLAQRLCTIHYVPYGIAQGYHYVGIHSDAQAIAAQNGITDEVILGKDWGLRA